MAQLSKKYGIEFSVTKMPAEKTPDLISRSAATERLQLELGEDLFSRPQEIGEKLRALELVLNRMPKPSVPNMKVVPLEVTATSFAGEIVVTGKPARNSVAAWIQNRNQRFGTRLIVDDGAFKNNANGFAVSEFVVLRSKDLIGKRPEQIKGVIAHEMAHTAVTARCAKYPDTCGKAIRFNSETDSMKFQTMNGYQKQFRSDEIESYKLSQTYEPKHDYSERILEFADKQTEFLRKMRAVVKDSPPSELIQPNPKIAFTVYGGNRVVADIPVELSFETLGQAQGFLPKASGSTDQRSSERSLS